MQMKGQKNKKRECPCCGIRLKFTKRTVDLVIKNNLSNLTQKIKSIMIDYNEVFNK